MNKKRTKYIFVTGGVVSSLGKGIIAASLGVLLKSQGFKVSRLKRVRYGSIFLPASLKQGDFKELSRQEVKSISNL